MKFFSSPSLCPRNQSSTKFFKRKIGKRSSRRRSRTIPTTRLLCGSICLIFQGCSRNHPQGWAGGKLCHGRHSLCHRVLPSPLVWTYFFQFLCLSRESVEATFSRWQGLCQLGPSIIIESRIPLHSRSYFILFKQMKNILILHLWHWTFWGRRVVSISPAHLIQNA